MRDYYEILSVSRSATDSEIKKAYRALARKYHPDLNPNDKEAEARFKEASEAYEVLRDEQKRQIYDQFGHEGLKGRGYQGFSGVDDIFSSFGDIFDSFFGFGGRGRQRGNGPRSGSDLETGVRITFREAVFGCKKQIPVERHVHCTHCSGEGAEPGSPVDVCATCRGQGQVDHVQGFFSVRSACPKCRGRGKTIQVPCKDCHGRGRILEKKKVEVEIPAGVDNGMRVRLSGEGEGGIKGGRPGDLYVFIEVLEDSKFRREEENLYSTVEIGIAQAAIGAEVQVETLEGDETIEIPKGSVTGDTLTLREKGVPHLRGGGRGNHYFEVRVLTPKRLSKKQEQLLREFAEESGESINPPKEGFLNWIKKKAT